MKPSEAANLLRNASLILEEHYDECEGYAEEHFGEYQDVALLRRWWARKTRPGYYEAAVKRASLLEIKLKQEMLLAILDGE